MKIYEIRSFVYCYEVNDGFISYNRRSLANKSLERYGFQYKWTIKNCIERSIVECPIIVKKHFREYFQKYESDEKI